MYLYDKMIGLLESQVGKGIYVWGRKGEDVSAQKDPEAWIRKYETTDRNAERAIAYYKKQKSKGISPILAFDCSGLMYWAGHQIGVFDSRLSSRGIYRACEEIDRKQVKRGDFVFRHNGTQIVHVGMYTGDAQVVECKGRDVGVTKTCDLDTDFNRYGRMKALQKEIDEPKYEDPIEDIYEPMLFDYVRVVGGKVHVREKGNILGKILFTAKRGQEFPLVGRADSGWYKIDVGGCDGYISNKPKYTEVIQK